MQRQPMRNEKVGNSNTVTQVTKTLGTRKPFRKNYIQKCKGFEDTQESSSLMCVLSKKDETGKCKITMELGMDGVAGKTLKKTF